MSPRLPDPVVDLAYQRLAKPLLFRLGRGDPEVAHDRTLGWLRWWSATPRRRALLDFAVGSTGRPRTVAGIRFPGLVGLAAGMDKNAAAPLAWSRLGFGFAELGTVTGQAQPGNPRPRMFRLKASGAVINRMGFNNHGADAVAARLEAAGVRRGNLATGIPLGISLGKTKKVDLDQAVEDYLSSLRTLAPHADYVAINVSSPNTPGLRTLQGADELGHLVRSLTRDAAARVAEGARAALGPVPIFVKLAPDLTWEAIDEALAVCTDAGAAGIIATNTTLERGGILPADRHFADEAGGLSGAPLTVRAREVVSYIARRTDLPVMGAGGIMSAEDARAMLDAGAQLVQIYTGFIYGGPSLVRGINRLTPAGQHTSS